MKKIPIVLLVTLAILTISSASAAEDPAVKKDMAKLQGEWSMVSGSADGQPMPEPMVKQMKRVCKGDEATTTMGSQLFMKAKITLDPSKKPKTIDYQMLDGLTKGKTQLGIYEIDGDTFKSCFAKPGADRPTDFKPGDGRTVSTWKRNKPAAPPSEQK
jgi:uncharacterized protein (TIGR03067 family)